MNKLNGIDDILALTPLQQGMLFHTLYTPESSVRNLQMGLALEGDQTEGALDTAWRLMVERHSALRTSFVWERVEKPYQVVHSKAHLKIARHDWRTLSAAEQEARWRSCLEEERSRLFDLGKPPLMRLALIVLSERKFRLVWTLHHIILEGWSAAIILNELWKCYADLRAHRSPDLPAVRPYAEFIHWLQQKDQSSAQAYWRERLKGFGAPSRLAIDRSVDSAPAEVRRIESCRLSLSRNLAEAARGFARKHRVTLNTVVQGAWSILLSRYSGERDVVFGAVLSGRPAELPGVESIVGLFVNTLPARVNVDGDAKLVPWLQALQLDQATMRQFEYSSLMQVQTWSDVPAGQPLFHTGLAFQNWLGNSASGRPTADLQVTELDSHETSDLPLTLQVLMGDTPTLSLVYDVERFDRVAVERMLAHFRVLIEGMVADPDRRVSDLPLLTEAERRQVLVEWNRSEVAFDGDMRLHRLFEEQAARTPRAEALVSVKERLSYEELNRRANRLAHQLRALGAKPETLVAVCLQRSSDLVVALLAVLKSGAAYVPLDPEYPAERIAFMLKDSQAAVLVTSSDIAGRLPPSEAQRLYLDQNESGASYPDTNPPGGAAPEHLAYIIYTSGSTGVPKGVAIEHRNAATLVHWARTVFTDDELRGVLASTSVCFDLSIFELFLPLAFGGRVILAENALHLLDLPARAEVTLVNTVPSAAAELVRMKGLPGSVSTVCLAGEPLPTRLVDQLYDTGTVQRVYDLYGPSEDTTYSTYTLRKRGVPPTIGRPITNTRAYVLDACMNPVPVGMPGELYLGGAGLARGYLGRPELTRERFLQDPFLGGAHRVYRTGDLVRYRPDAQLEYLGRLDHQVKLRGFRIELGEIETGIARHPAIREVVVIVREDTPGDKRLVAYLVANDAPEDLVEQLRALLRARLPAYMMPAHFVALEALPLTPNGKVNRKALPAPELSRSSAGPSYAAPRTPTESAIAQIWSAVLGVEKIGIHDHFFELGGDSILSIQVIARCRQAGLRLTPRDLFKRPTIAQLAQACAQPAAELAGPQEPLSGAVQFTPIQRWFLEQDFADPHHWNQAFLFELPADVDLGVLEQALHCVLRHHDALRLRLPAGTGWTQEYAADGALPAISRIDLAGIAADERAAAVEAQATRVQSSLEEGCLLRAVHFAFGAGERGRLLLVIHHLAVDGVSWRLISEDLESAYSSLKAGQPPALQPKTTSYQAWAARLAGLASSASLRRPAEFWLTEAAKPVSALPAERDDCENLEGDARSVKTRLTVEDTRALLQRVPTAYRTQVNDVLLTALARALQRWTGGEAFRIDLEGHGREDLFADVDVSRTVGWFTTIFPVRLELQAGLDEGQALKSVKEQLRRVPDRGLSYGLLRYAGDDAETRAALSQSPRSQLLFNYLGQFDQVVAGSSLLSFAAESIGPWHSPAARRTHALEVLCLVRAGGLEIEWAYHPAIHRRETIERVAQDFLAALSTIIAHCLAADAGGRTPSDFPLAALSQEALDKLWARYPGFEDVYPLSPMQRLFYVAESAHADLESEPWHFRLEGAIDAALLRRSIERVVQRHPILRTAFAAEISAEPLQVVLREVPAPWSEEDWRGLPEAEQQARLAALMQSNRRTRFDLTRPPLMRTALLRTGDETYHLLWGTHHLHVDGWSWPLIFGEVSKIYAALRQGREPQLERPCPFRSYVAWLRDEAPDSEPFWKETLAGFETPTPLNLAAPPSGPQAPATGFAGETVHLDRDTTAVLQSLARSQRVTLSTIVQAAWALLLSHYSGSRDVIFGAAFSGRPAEVPGIESLVGPCVTNLPVRVAVAPQEPLLPWMLSLQQRQFELAHHQHAALEQIQTWANLPWRYRLFDSLIVFQNYQVDDAARRIGEDARMVPISGPGTTSYPLTIMVVPEQELELQFICHPGEFAPEVVRTYATDLTAILQAMAQRPDQALAELLAGLPASSRGRAAATAATKAAGATPIGTAVAPRTPSEELVIGVFRDLLDRADFGVLDDFFDLGGNSVAAAQLMSRLRAASGCELPLRDLFERPTVAGLAEAIDGLAWAARSKAPTYGAGKREEIEL